VPERLAAFLERALAKEADQRFQTGEHFSGALRDAYGAAAQATMPAADVDIKL
jgi:hypothetical protein